MVVSQRNIIATWWCLEFDGKSSEATRRVDQLFRHAMSTSRPLIHSCVFCFVVFPTYAVWRRGFFLPHNLPHFNFRCSPSSQPRSCVPDARLLHICFVIFGHEGSKKKKQPFYKLNQLFPQTSRILSLRNKARGWRQAAHAWLPTLFPAR